MNKTITLLICCWALAFGAQGMGSNFLPTTAIDGSWMSERIPVNSSDGTADVMTLLKAFHTAWPTEAVQALIAEAGDRRFVTNDVTDCEDCTGHVFVDCDDINTASYDNGEPGSQRVEARTYQRENGHTLFAIRLEETGIGQQPFCCFYDYNPDTRMMTPEDAPYIAMKRKWADSEIHYHLGFGYDQTIIVQETSPNAEDRYHHYVFNGMKHIFHHSGEDFYQFEDEDEDDAEYGEVYLPQDAELKDENDDMEVYVTIDGVGSENGQWSVWLRKKNTSIVQHLFFTNNTAAPRWSEMQDGNGIRVSIDEIAAGDCYNCEFIPWDPDKIFVEGCPDGRNVWSYIVDFKTKEAIQLPSNEGLIAIDPESKTIHMSNYYYHPEGGRYSMERVYTIDGKFTGQEYRIPD